MNDYLSTYFGRERESHNAQLKYRSPTNIAVLAGITMWRTTNQTSGIGNMAKPLFAYLRQLPARKKQRKRSKRFCTQSLDSVAVTERRFLSTFGHVRLNSHGGLKSRVRQHLRLARLIGGPNRKPLAFVLRAIGLLDAQTALLTIDQPLT